MNIPKIKKYVDINLNIRNFRNHTSEMNKFYNRAKYEIIHTDRLHVAIGALSWDITVKIYTGNYLKILDI
jgi:hypothetical protein